MIGTTREVRRTIRGRQLLAVDVLVLTLSFAVIGQLTDAAPSLTWVWVLVTGARIAALMQTGTYQHVREHLSIRESTRITVAVLLASAGAYAALLVVVAPNSAIFLRAFPETAVALAALLGCRTIIWTIGFGRRGAADDSGTIDFDLDDAPPELRTMIEATLQAPPLFQASGFWQPLSRRHLAMLVEPHGLDTFKRTLNSSYFQFGLPAFARAVPGLMRAWLSNPDPAVLSARSTTGTLAGKMLAVSIALYAHAVRGRPGGTAMVDLIEPDLGGALEIRYAGRRITEDLCHSVEEYACIMSHLPQSLRLERVVELGAGYGRLTWAFARLNPALQYHIVDIPPALYLSQYYLTSVFPNETAFRFRPFQTYESVASEMAKARFVFLEPQQLGLLPRDYASLVMTVSTLHEMNAEQVREYIQLVDRICGGAFYTKQWRTFYNHADRVTHRLAAYPIPAHWRRLYEGSPLVPPSFFEALYLCRTAT